MQKKEKILWLGVVTGAYLLLTRVRRAVRNLAWRFGGLDVIASNNETNSCTIRLLVQLRNSTPISIRLNSISGELYAQGVRIGVVNQSANQLIQANSISNVDIIGELYWDGVAQAIKTNILSGDVRNLNFEFVGYLEVENRKIKIDQLITFQELIG